MHGYSNTPISTGSMYCISGQNSEILRSWPVATSVQFFIIKTQPRILHTSRSSKNILCRDKITTPIDSHEEFPIEAFNIM